MTPVLFFNFVTYCFVCIFITFPLPMCVCTCVFVCVEGGQVACVVEVRREGIGSLGLELTIDILEISSVLVAFSLGCDIIL